MLLIIHIPKTAGTSLRQSLLEQYGKSHLALDYGGQSEDTSSVVNQYLYQGEAILGVKKLVEELRATGYQAIIGHYALSKYGEFFHADEVITLVPPRIPIQSRSKRISSGAVESGRPLTQTG